MIRNEPAELLGIPRDADEIQILAAYGRIAEVFDPERWRDASPGVQEEAIAWTRALNEARDAMLSSAKRGNRQQPALLTQ